MIKIARILTILCLVVCSALIMLQPGVASEQAPANADTGSSVRAACTHSDDNYKWVVTKKPTCTSSGTEEYVCQICGNVKNGRSIPFPNPGEHNWKETGRVASTCTVAGHINYTCSKCSDTKQESLPLANHSYRMVTVKAPTCLVEGTMENRCSVCGKVNGKKSIPALSPETGHSWTVTSTVDSTCTRTGTRTSKCSRCDEKKTETIEKKDHNCQWVVVSEPTCTADGKMLLKCKICDYVKAEEPIISEGHRFYWVLTSSTDPTCFKEGSKTYTCSRCGTTKTETIAKLDHDFQWIVTAEPTCTAYGTKKYICKKCNTVQKEESFGDPHHNWVLSETVASTCSTAGYKTYKCSVCASTRKETLEKLQHNYSWVTVSMPTSTAVGKEDYKCSGCNSVTDSRALYLISFNSNGGSTAPASLIKTQGKDLTLPASILSQTGYTFLGWSTSKAATTATYTAGATFKTDKNTTLYAVWKISKYQVVFDINGGDGTVQPITANYGTTVTIPLVSVSKVGNYFLGWATYANATAPKYKSRDTIIVTGNITLYAVWQKKKVTLSYEKENCSGSVPAARTVYYGEALTIAKTNLSREGYYFLGWATTSGATTPQYKSGDKIVLTANTKLYPVLKIQMRHLTYDINGGTGTVPASVTVKYGGAVTVGKSNISRDGYYFIGWATYTGATKPEYKQGNTILLYEDTVLVAVWQPMKWNVTFDANGGKGTLPKSFVAETNVWHAIGNASLSRDGYYFLGWSISKYAKSAEYTSKDCIRVHSDTVLYAVWSLKNVDLKYDTNGLSGIVIKPERVPYGSTIKVSTYSLYRDGYWFLGWSTVKEDPMTVKSAQYKGGSPIKLTKDVTILYAVWQHKHTYDSHPNRIDENNHANYCTSCKKWIPSSHTKKICVMTETNGEPCGIHGTVCVDAQGNRCGEFDKWFESCYYHLKDIKIYREYVINKDSTITIWYKLTGVCSTCGVSVTMTTHFVAAEKPKNMTLSTLQTIGKLVLKLPQLSVVAKAYSVIKTINDGVNMIEAVGKYLSEINQKEVHCGWEILTEESYITDMTIQFLTNPSAPGITKEYVAPANAVKFAYFEFAPSVYLDE